MNIIKKHVAVIALSTIAIFGLSACGTPAASTPDPEASAAVAEEPTVEPTTEPAAEEVTPPPVNELIKQFGEVVTYEDGLSVSLSQPIPFSPGEYAMGAVDGQTPMVFKVVVTNGTEAAIDPYTYVTVSSAGAEAATIADVQNPEYGDIGLSPTTSVLPGQTVEWYIGFSIADAANITAEVQTGFATYESAIFTNIAF